VLTTRPLRVSPALCGTRLSPGVNEQGFPSARCRS
jgi:hypothetical protein